MRRDNRRGIAFDRCHDLEFLYKKNDYLKFYFKKIFVKILPEGWPDVIAHDIKPEEAKKDAEVNHISRENAWPFFDIKKPSSQLHNYQTDVKNCEPKNVAHQGLSMEVP